MVEIKAADLEVRCFFTWRMKGHICSYGSRGMETGDWGLDGCRLSAYRYPWDGIPERGPRLQTIRLQTLDSIDFTYHSGVPPLWWLTPPPCPVGSMSLDSRVAELPYESSSFATPAVRWGGKRKAP